MALETVPGLGVKADLGVPEINIRAAKPHTDGELRELRIQNITGDNYSEKEGTLPAGARIKDVTFRVNTAATLSTVGATIDVGTVGSVATNNVDLIDTDAEAVGTYFLADAGVTLNGTWAAELAAETSIAIAPSAGTFTGGDIDLVITYVV